MVPLPTDILSPSLTKFMCTLVISSHLIFSNVNSLPALVAINLATRTLLMFIGPIPLSCLLVQHLLI